MYTVFKELELVFAKFRARLLIISLEISVILHHRYNFMTFDNVIDGDSSTDFAQNPQKLQILLSDPPLRISNPREVGYCHCIEN